MNYRHRFFNQMNNPYRFINQRNNRHRVFVSYYHREDQYYWNQFEGLFSDIHDIMISESVEIGDIDPNLNTETIRRKIRDKYLRDSTVTVVLAGARTWQRKFVDWEIGSSIRPTQNNPRSGLLGFLLPTYPRPPDNPTHYYIHIIPPRLHDNIQRGFATIHKWSDDPYTVQLWIHNAFQRRRSTEILPDNSRDSFKNNRLVERWYD